MRPKVFPFCRSKGVAAHEDSQDTIEAHVPIVDLKVGCNAPTPKLKPTAPQDDPPHGDVGQVNQSVNYAKVKTRNLYNLSGGGKFRLWLFIQNIIMYLSTCVLHLEVIS
jgi:hypothetical protein